MVWSVLPLALMVDLPIQSRSQLYCSISAISMAVSTVAFQPAWAQDTALR